MVFLEPYIDPRVQQAFVAGAVVAVGWMVNGRQNRRARLRQREERLRDVHRALYAEIASYLENLQSEEALLAYRDQMLAHMRENPGFIPLIPTEQNDTIFRTILPEIHILPRTSIDPVVAYYNQLFAIESLVTDMRGDGFKELDHERRAAMYSDYIALKTQALADGNYALKMITAFAEGGRAKARDQEVRVATEVKALSKEESQKKPSEINTPDVDPSGPSRE
ncbi:hypothetical protein [Parasulfitobacter algicola]|uniref:Uncharacterized protein n=1 Tax=Parasulfitobacter algicola TaxID=2614809 RepID=A0ABX2IUF1_9RHOB|nr:hypothetical protein [Sulfitobacter algicola]NSX56522.1 hypothetical protein [Sulfitobacter algicola]